MRTRASNRVRLQNPVVPRTVVPRSGVMSRATARGARVTLRRATMPISCRPRGRRAIPRTIAPDPRAFRPSAIRRVHMSRRPPRVRCPVASANCRARGRPRRGIRRSSAQSRMSRATPSCVSFRRHRPPRFRYPRPIRRRPAWRNRQSIVRSRRRATRSRRTSRMAGRMIGLRLCLRRWNAALQSSRRPSPRRGRPSPPSRAVKAVARKASRARAGRRAAASRLTRRNPAPARHRPNPATRPDRPRSRAGFIGITTCASPASWPG